MAITIDLSILGNGTYTIEDDGIPGNGTSVVRDPFGNIVTTFAHPADALTILSRPGQNININIIDSLTTANFTIGNIDNAFASQRPDNVQIGGVLTSGAVVLTANQAVTEWGGDGATDIVAGSLLVRAGTGIGTGGNFIETQVSALEAESTTGGIAFSNINDVVLNVASAQGNLLRGLRTESGNVTLINQGSILLSDNDGVASVHSGGHLSLMAIGSSADISSNVDRDALMAVGNLTLSAGRDVLFGTVGADFDNDVRAGGSVTITAGRDFHIDGFSDMAADDQGLASNGGISITAGRDILIEDDNGADASVGITASGSTGAVVLTTGLGGTLSLAANSSTAILGRLGGVVINADRVLIDSDSGIAVSGTGSVTVRGASAGRLIQLGSVTDGVFALELSDAELDRIVASSVTVGGANAGQVSVVGAITHSNPALVIESGADVLVQADITATAGLTLRAAEDVVQASTSSITAGDLNIFVDAPDTDGPGGSNVLSGLFSVTNGTVHGGSDADTLRGADTVDLTVHGFGGTDTLISTGEGHYFGDEGGDTIFAGLSTGLVPEVLDGGAGIDTLDTRSFSGNYTINLGTGATNFVYESFVNFENLITGGGNDTISGSSAENNIQSGTGDDTINGGAGADTMTGGAGNDFYFVDNGGDVATEASGEGTDHLFSSVNYVLAAGQHIEFLRTTSIAGTDAINLTGNELANTLLGNNGANVLNGGEGIDTLTGFLGNDFYFVDNAADVVQEASGEGTDQVFSSVSYTLAAGQHIETLRTTNIAGADAINLAGNALANTLLGNAGANTLNGGGGADTLQGLGGNDLYYVDAAGDVVQEAAGAGTDQVFTSVSYALGAGQHVETLRTTSIAGTTAINLTGNALANTLLGNNGANALNGDGGADTLQGFAGNDTFGFTTALGAGNVDAIVDYTVADDAIQIDNAVFTGLAAGALAASAFRTGAAAADADDRIIYNSATGALLFDADGNGAGAAVQFATLSAGLAMTAGEFTVI